MITINNFYKILSNCILAILLLGMTTQMFATHVVGGNLMYKCLGNDQWEITLEFANDCGIGDINALAEDSFATIQFFDPITNTVLTNIENNGRIEIELSEIIRLGDETVACRVFEDPVCVTRQVYRDTVTLPFRPDGYIFSYRRCCRNSSLLNVVDPLDTGTTEWIILTAEAQTLCNSSPVYRDWPTVYICTNEDLVFDHSARDTDGDSLVYRLCVPSAGGDSNPVNSGSDDTYFPPFNDVTFAAGYNLNNLLGTGTPLEVDPVTGLLTANPGMVGQYIVGVCVDEYRDGVLLSTVRRNFQYNARNCTDPPFAAVVPDLNPNCESLEVCFENNSMSTQGNPLTYNWIFDFPEGTLTDSIAEPCVTYPAPGLYTAALIVEDGFCNDTTFVDVGVSIPGDPTAAFELVSAQSCDEGVVVSLNDLSQTSQDITDWVWTVAADGQTQSSTDQNPNFAINGDQTITVTLIVTTISGCTDEITMDLDIVATPGLGLDLPDSLEFCIGEDVLIVDEIPDDLTIEVDPDDIVTVMNGMIVLTGSGTMDIITITISNEICTVSQDIQLFSFEDPVLPDDLLDGIIPQCGEQPAILNPNGDPNFTYNWTSSDPNLEFDMMAVSPEVFVTMETTFTVEVTNGPCSVTGSVTVVPQEGVIVPEELIQESIIQCGANSVVLNPNGNPDYTYQWFSSDPSVNFDNTAVSPTVFVTQESSFTVIITNGPCSAAGEVTVIPQEGVVGLVFENLNIGCNDSPTIALNPNGNPSYDYIWTSSDPNITFMQNIANPVVTVTTTTTFFVTVMNGPCTESFQFTVNVEEEFTDVNLPNIELGCYDGTPVALNPNGNPTYNYTWNSDDPNLVLDVNAVNPQVTLTMETEFSVLILNGLCSEAFTFTVGIDGVIPDLSAIPTMNGTCLGSPVSLYPNANPDLTYQWTSSDPSVVFDMTAPNPVVEVTQPTTFIVTVSDGPCTATASVQVTVDSGPVVDLSNSVLQCIGTEVELNPRGNTDFLYEWEATNPDILFDQSDPNPIVSVEENTTFNVTITDPNNAECSRVSFVDVLVPPAIELEVDVAVDTTFFLCLGDSLTVNATSSVDDIVWLNEVGDTIVVGNQIIIPYEEPQVYTVFAMDQFGCTSSLQIDVDQAPQGGIEIFSSTGDLTYCPDEEVTLTASVDDQILSDIVWFDGNGNPIGEGPELVINPTGDVSYSLTAINEFGCPGEAMINLFETPLDVIIEGPTVICLGDSATLTAIVDSAEGDITYNWQPTGAIDGDNTGSSVTIMPGVDTDYVVTVTDDSGCSGVAIYTVSVQGPGPVTATVDVEEIPLGGTAQLGVMPFDPSWTYSWDPSEFLDDPFSPTPIATITESGTFTFTVTITAADGCVSTGSVSVVVSGACDAESIFIPNMFTPNGDSYNDVFQVYSNQIDEMTLLVYDRWGEEIITISGVDENWDGTFGGKQLSPDVYAYCIQARCFNGEEFTQRGNITLMR